MDNADIANRFDYHAPEGDKAQRHQDIRTWCRSLAESLNAVLPESREKSLAITHLEEAMMWSNAAIARHDG